MNPIETLLSILFLMIYVFANFRLTRLIHPQRTIKPKTELIAYALSFMLTALLIANSDSNSPAGFIVPVLVLWLCQSGILFLYQRDWKHMIYAIFKLFAADALLAELYFILSKRSFEHMDWQTFFWLLAPVKLIAVLLLESTMRRREKERVSLQMEMYRHQMEIMEQSQEQIRFLRHDMINHLLHMNQLLLEQDTNRLREYVQETAAHLDLPQEFVRSGNRDIDSLLNYKLMSAKQLGAEIITDMRIPQELPVSSYDLNVILGNLLDNALEALNRCDAKSLTVSLRYEAGVLYILVQNACDGQPPAVSRKGAGHGLGLQSIRHTLEAYHGDLKTDYRDHTFTAAVMLYLNR